MGVLKFDTPFSLYYSNIIINLMHDTTFIYLFNILLNCAVHQYPVT